MKTPDEIKKALQCRVNGCSEKCDHRCDMCELYVPNYRLEDRYADAHAYIQQLESCLAQVKREKDAAVADLMTASMNLCSACKYDSWPECGKTGRLNLDADDAVACKHFEWRGVCEENTKEEER